MADYPVIPPDTQISFYYRLKELDEIYLSDALSKTIEKLNLSTINNELEASIKNGSLERLAAFGLRGERFFPIPSIIRANPFLLGYYRLLYGISQKTMYNGKHFGKFKQLEEKGIIPSALDPEIEKMCISLIRTGEIMVSGLDTVTLEIIRDLQVLTLGPQLRGGRNTNIGQKANQAVYDFIKELVEPYIVNTSQSLITIKNNSERKIVIRFSSDPDVSITEQVANESLHLVAIEIKGGTDASNIHNRVGEAEKSHQKAKLSGYNHCWTIIRVDREYDKLKKESPTTTQFYHLDKMRETNSEENIKFKNHLSSLLGITI